MPIPEDDAELFPGFTPPPVFPRSDVPPPVPEPLHGLDRLERRRLRRARFPRLLAVAAGIFVAVTLHRELTDRGPVYLRTPLAARNAPEFWESPRFDSVEKSYLKLAEEIRSELDRAASRPTSTSLSVSYPDSHAAGLMDHLSPVLPRAGQPTGGEERLASGERRPVHRLLVLEDAARTLEDEVAVKVRRVFEQDGFQVFDRRTESDGGPQEIDLFAGARNAIGLSGLDDRMAVEKLQRFLDGTDDVDAILWIARDAEPDKYRWHLLTRS